jgi:hypothetical protein
MMGRKWTPAQRAKFIKTMAAKRKGEKQSKGVEIPLDLIPAPRVQPIAKKVQKVKGKPLETQEMEALGEIITNVWLALCRKNRGL